MARSGIKAGPRFGSAPAPLHWRLARAASWPLDVQVLVVGRPEGSSDVAGGRKLRVVPGKFTPGFLQAPRPALPACARCPLATYNELVSALGGEDQSLPQRKMLAERATWLHLMLQQTEQAFLKSGQPLVDSYYSQSIHALLSVLGKLGLKRVPRDVHSLTSHLAGVK